MNPKKLQGVLLFVSALFLFASVDTAAKYLTAFFSVPLLVWARYLVHLLLMLAFVAPHTGRSIVVTQKPGLMILRGLMLVVSSFFMQLALSTLPIAETTAIVFVSPLIVALLAKPVLGEKLRLVNWLATLGGFAGVLLIVRPGGIITGPGVLYALFTALTYAIYQLLTRKLAGTEPVMRQLFFTALVGTVVTTFLVPFYWTGELPTAGQALLIVSLGLFGGTGHFFLIRAFRDTPASTLSPMLYLQVVWVSLLGWLVFGQLPDLTSIIGITTICLSGLLLVLQRNRSGTA